MQAATESRIAEFQTVPISQLEESRTNPRKHFAKDSLQDLTQSVKEKGILVPLLVRRVEVPDTRPGTKYGNAFEIIAGARRYRAAKAAGFTEIPILIRDLNDEQALEVQVIENLQRSDVHPLEEAQGYKQLLEKGKYEIADLAAKVGKSESYIYQRLKLAELVPAGEKAFLEETLSAGHAILIARLQPEQQKEALEYALDEYDKPSVRDLSEWIQREIFLDLHSAAFPKDSAELLPGVVACVNCPKRTGFTPALFTDIKKKDTCTDASCFHKKADVFVRLKIAEESEKAGKLVLQLTSEYGKPKQAGALSHDLWQEYEAKGAKCPSAEQGVVLDGRNQGKTIAICRDKKCKVHARQVRESGGGAVDKYRDDQRKQEKKRRNEMELRRRILRAIAEKSVQPIEKLTLAHWQILAKYILNRMSHDSEVLFAGAMGIEPKTTKHAYGGTSKDFGAPLKAKVLEGNAPKIARWLLLAAASPNLECGTYEKNWDRASLDGLAKLEGVKVADIEKQFKTALAAKAAKKTKPTKVQTAAKAKKTKKAA
jgi:ParB family chromosome partitioning protein